MRRLRWIWITTLCLVIIGMIVACGAAGPVASHGGPVKDHVSFVDALRVKGLVVVIAGSVAQPFLRAKATALRVSGGALKQTIELQLFNYDDTDLGTDGLKAAAEDASQLDREGNPRTMHISWIAPPHFFRRERVIVIYLGSDADMLALLTELLILQRDFVRLRDFGPFGGFGSARAFERLLTM